MKKRLVDADKLMERAKMNSVLVTVEHDHHDYGLTLGTLNKIVKECELPSVEAIPVEWIERKIARLKEMDNAFASLTASQIRALLNDWRAEQNE